MFFLGTLLKCDLTDLHDFPASHMFACPYLIDLCYRIIPPFIILKKSTVMPPPALYFCHLVSEIHASNSKVLQLNRFYS